MDDWTKRLMEEMRANGGKVVTGPLAGKPHLIMTSTGAKTGQERQAVLSYVRDGDAFVVAGTAGGSPVDPSWVHNVKANPQVTLEAEGTTFTAEASIVEDGEWPRLWDALVDSRPDFAAYPGKAGRHIPIVKLEPRPG
jgi:deazaflavin-dependent oxidoreductase (nitroreductase family)